jgi:hypothetical protein
MATADVAGVRIVRHPLEREAERLMGITNRLGARLRFWLRKVPAEVPVMTGEGEDARPAIGPDGGQIMQPVMPDRDWRETYDLYQRSVLGMLKEQRERAKLVGAGKGGLPLSDAEADAELAELVKASIREMPAEELQALLAERVIDVAPAPAAEPETELGPLPGMDVTE